MSQKDVKKKPQKKSFDIQVYDLLKQGLNQNQISKKLNTSRQRIAYYTHKLRSEGVVSYKGYGVYTVPTCCATVWNKISPTINNTATTIIEPTPI